MNETQTKTVQCWQVTGPNVLAQGTYELPEALPAGYVELEPLVVGVCGSDIDLIKKGGAHSSHKGSVQPIIPGHEPIARVARIADGVTRVRVGDIVAVEPALPCCDQGHSCEECEDGRYHTCRSTLYMATPPQDGCFAKLFQWPAHRCHKLPEGLKPLVASLVEPLAACMQAIARRKLAVPYRKGHLEYEAIIGGGAMAMGVLALRKAQSSENKVMVLVRNEADAKFAEELGADLVIRLSQKEGAEAKAENVAIFKQAREKAGKRVSAAYECTGNGAVLEAAIEARLVRGEGCYVGLGCHYEIAFDKAMLRRDEASLMPVRRSKDKFPTVLDILVRHSDLFEKLIGRIVSYDELPQIMEKKGGGKETGTGGPKTVVQF